MIGCNPERVSSVFTFVSFCLCVCTRGDTEHTFWSRNLIFLLVILGTWKKTLFFSLNFQFYAFYWWKNLVVTWLDIANAYGSIPHDVIMKALERAHIPENTRSLIKSYYSDVRIRFSTGKFTTDWQRLEKGIRNSKQPRQEILWHSKNRATVVLEMLESQLMQELRRTLQVRCKKRNLDWESKN